MRVLLCDGCIAHWCVGIKARRLIGSVELIEPDFLKRIMLESGHRCRLVYATEQEIAAEVCRDIEYVQSLIL